MRLYRCPLELHVWRTVTPKGLLGRRRPVTFCWECGLPQRRAKVAGR